MVIKTLDLGEFIFNNASPFSVSTVINRSGARLAAADMNNSTETTGQGRKGRLAVTHISPKASPEYPKQGGGTN